MILAAATTSIIDRRFTVAARWALAAALLSACGLMHSYRYTPGDTAIALVPAWPWAIGYAAMAALFLATRSLGPPPDDAER